ncbi:hypothetical protein Tco_0057438, partial [Tanacetum coccineum]
PLNPPPPASNFEPEDVIEVEDTVEPENETVLASVHEVGESSTASFHREDSDGLLPGLMRKDINSLFGRIASLSRRVCGRETAHALVEKKGKAKDKYYGKLIADLGNEVRIRQKSQENHQKKGQTRTRERKSVQEPEAKVKRIDNSRALQQNAKDKVVISKALISSPSSKATWKMGKHNRMIGFTLE